MLRLSDVYGTLYRPTTADDPQLAHMVYTPTTDAKVCRGYVLAVGDLPATQHRLPVVCAFTRDDVTYQLLDLTVGAIVVAHESALDNDERPQYDAPTGEWWYCGLQLQHNAVMAAIDQLYAIAPDIELYWLLDEKRWTYLKLLRCDETGE